MNDISNKDAFDWMKENIPLIEILPKVSWAKEYNSINAAAGHHLAEGRWLKNSYIYLEDYIRFWLNRRDKGYIYSMWLIFAMWEYCEIRGDYRIGVDNLDALCEYYAYWEATHLEPCGILHAKRKCAS